MDSYPRPRANVLVICNFSRILKSSPAADVVHQDCLKAGRAGLHFQHQRLKSVTTVHSQTATAGIFKYTHDCEAALLSIATNRVELIFGGVFLEVRRHPNIGSG